MPRKRQETPFDEVMRVMSAARLYEAHGDVAIETSSYANKDEFLSALIRVAGDLLDARNMINSIASLSEKPQVAAIQHIETDVIKAALDQD